MVGPKYQAKIPPLGSYIYQERGSWHLNVQTEGVDETFVTPLVFVSPAYSSEDQLLWTPGVLPVQEVEDFLIYAQRPYGQRGPAGTQAQGDTVRDNEQVCADV